MKPIKLLCRHPLAGLISLLAAGVALWVGYYLATFDLNHYRDYLTDELGRRLQLPVRIGEAHLELREAGIACRFTDLQIGTAQTRTELHAAQLRLQLAWHGLLLRKPVFTEIALDTPLLRIAPPAEASSAASPADGELALNLLQELRIRQVEISQGAVDLSWIDRAGALHSFSLANLAVSLDGFGPARTATFDLAGTLPGETQGGRLTASGRIDLTPEAKLREATWDVILKATELDAVRIAGLLPDDTGVTAEGRCDLELFVKGRFDDTLTVQAQAAGRQLRVRPGTAYRQAIPLSHLQLAGNWQREDRQQVIRQLAIQLDDLRVAGEITVNTTDTGRELTGTLSNASLPVGTLQRWLPPDLQTEQPLLAALRPGGSLTLSLASFRATWPAAPQERGSLTVDGVDGEAHDLAWNFGEKHRVELTALRFRLAAGQWHFTGGNGVAGGLPVTFSGQLLPQAETPPRIDINLHTSTTAGQLLSLWPGSPPQELLLAGPVTLTGRASGSTEQFTVDARANLEQLDLRYGEHLHLAPAPGAALTLHGQGTPAALAIEQATLTLAPLQGRLSGTVAWGEAPGVDLTAQLEAPDLTAVHAAAPLLGKLQIAGRAVLEATASGPLEALRPRLALDLYDVGVPTRGIVADLTRLNGRLQFEGRGVYGDRLTVRLGNSPVRLKARVADLEAPRLQLDVLAPAVRADELIFRSDRTTLRDLQGTLIFDRDGLFFAPLKVHLDGGTRATIRGSVKNYAAPQVDLEISGEYANVEEIIALWTDESPAAKAARTVRRSAADHREALPPIRIKVDAKSGDLYSMKFVNAKAVITPTAERLLLHPLDFSVDSGYCTTQVLVDFTGSDPVLRVSGHAEGVDAYQIYNELLDRKSIMRGTLRGDFYLQGELGKDRFLPTSTGNVSATVSDGVMRHSPMLSTIFSLLNVSQLFKFQLPDINLEGLPFTLLTTELAIDQGVISTERLVIDSDAISMSYAGQYDMVKNRLDLLVVAKPLGTIDKVVTHLPIAGWILGGEERALITAQFRVTGSTEKPKVEAIPISAISKGVLGIFQRTLGLPLKLVEDPAILWGGGAEKKD